MRMHREHHLLHGHFGVHGGHGFGDEFGRLRSDDVYAEYFAVLRISYYLDETVVIAHDGGLRVPHERELAHLHLQTFFLGLRFGHAHAGDLWVCVCAARDASFFHWARVLAGDLGNGDHAFHRARMRQLRKSGYDVADGVDARFGRLHPLIHWDESAVEFDVGLLHAHVARA